jgi:hypothetical protein
LANGDCLCYRDHKIAVGCRSSPLFYFAS